MLMSWGEEVAVLVLESLERKGWVVWRTRRAEEGETSPTTTTRCWDFEVGRMRDQSTYVSKVLWWVEVVVEVSRRRSRAEEVRAKGKEGKGRR